MISETNKQSSPDAIGGAILKIVGRRVKSENDFALMRSFKEQQTNNRKEVRTMSRLSFEELKVGCHYIATDKDGRKHKATCADVNGRKYVFCCYPTFTCSGEENDLIEFEEVEK